VPCVTPVFRVTRLPADDLITIKDDELRLAVDRMGDAGAISKLPPVD
jgi:hypothetical protein